MYTSNLHSEGLVVRVMMLTIYLAKLSENRQINPPFFLIVFDRFVAVDQPTKPNEKDPFGP